MRQDTVLEILLSLLRRLIFSCNQATLWMVQSVCPSIRPQLYHWKTNCCVGRSTVLLENRLYYWKIICDAGRSMVLLEDQLYWRQSTGLDVNYRSRKITARRRLHKYVGAECGAYSFTWYLYQICNTDVRLSVRPSHVFDYVPIIVSSWNFQELLPMTEVTSMDKVKVRGQRSRSQRSTTNLVVSGQ